MGVVTLQARGVKVNQGWAVTGAASIQAALSDGSDSSYVTPGTGFLISDFNDITTQLPDLAQIRSARAGIRLSANSGSNGTVSVGWDVRLINGTTPFQQLIHNLKPGSSPGQWWFPWSPYAPDKTRWNLYGVNAAEMSLLASSGIKVYETFFQVQYNEAPVVTVTGPTGTVKDDATPTVTWLYSDVDGDAQERWQVRIFTLTQTQQPGFSPDSTATWWDSGSMWSRAPSSTSVQVPNPMPPGGWVAYVRASDAGSNGRWGLWASSSFTLTGKPPAVPSVTVAVDPANQRAGITVHALDNLLTRADAASMDAQGGAVWSWSVEQGGTLAVSTVGGGDTSLAALATGNGTTPYRMVTLNRYRVTEGKTYTGLATFIGIISVRSCRVGLRFYDNTATQIGSDAFGANVTSSVSGVQASESVPAPAGAVTAALVVEIAGMVSTETHKVHLFSLAEGSSTVPFRGGLDSPNLLDQNSADFEGGIGVWTGIGATLASVTDGASVHGSKVATATATATGQIALTSSTTLFPVIPGEQYTILGSFKPSAAGSQIQLRMYLYDGNGWTGANLGSAATTLATGQMTPLAFTATIPDGITGVQLRVYQLNVTSGDVLKADAFSFHHGDGTAWKDGFGVASWPQVEYSDDGGTTWATVRIAGRPEYDELTRLSTVYDYEAPPNSPRLYRARTSVSDQWLPAELLSDPSSSVSATLPNTVWVLKDPIACVPGLVVSHRGDLALSADIQQEVANVQGRRTPVVLSDVPGGETIPLALTVRGADWETFEAMRKQNRALLLQSDMTDQWYLRIIGARKATLVNNVSRKTAPVRIVEITCVEVERP